MLATTEVLASRYAGKTVLAVGAHPEDIEMGVGGTIAYLSRAGARVVMVLACVPGRWSQRLAQAERSAGILGAELRLILGRGYHRVEDVKTYELVRTLDGLLDELKPAAVFTHSAVDGHKDHRMVNEACHAAHRPKFLDFFCYLPTPCAPSSNLFHPHVFVDITETLELKVRALGSQADFLRDKAREQGRFAGVAYAEGLQVSTVMLM